MTSNKDQAAHMNMILDVMREDGVLEAFASSSKEQQVDLVRAYSQEVVRRVNKMATAYLTNEQVKSDTDRALFAELKGAA